MGQIGTQILLLGSSDNGFFCIEPWTIFFGSLQFNDILFILDNRKSTCHPYHQKERKTTWPIYKWLLVPNAEIASGIRCWSWGWMPFSPWRCAGWNGMQENLCHLPPKPWELQTQPRCHLCATPWWESSHCTGPMQLQVAIPTGQWLKK